jgi:phage terminase small subunit
MELHKQAVKDYILGMSYQDIADKYNVALNTVKSWKKRHGWTRDKPSKKGAHSAPQNTKVCTTKTEEVQEPEPDEELSDQEQLFAYHYVRTWNAMQAAMLAGYCVNNKYSAQVQGFKLKNRPRVAKEIERLKELFRQDIHVDIQDFLGFCMKVVSADVGDYLQFGQRERPILTMDGTIIDEETGKPITEIVNYVSMNESSMLDTTLIQEVKQGKDGVSIKMVSKEWAWEQLKKYFDWLPDKWKREMEEKKHKLERDKINNGGGNNSDQYVIYELGWQGEDNGDSQEKDHNTLQSEIPPNHNPPTTRAT